MQTETSPPETAAPVRQPPYLVRAVTRGWYHDAPGKHYGAADKQGWSIRQRVREPGDVFEIRHLRHFSAASDGEPGQPAMFGWMEWADQAPRAEVFAPGTTAANQIQDPLSIGREPVMVDRPGEHHGHRAPPQWPTGAQPQATQQQERVLAERMATSGVKQPQPPRGK